MASRIPRYSDARHAIRLSLIELLTDTENRRDKSIELPIFTSDDWDALAQALLFLPRSPAIYVHSILFKVHHKICIAYPVYIFSFTR